MITDFCYKGAWVRSATAVAAADYTAPDGTVQHYELSERLIELAVPAQPATAGRDVKPASILTLRLIVRRSPDGHQAPILTNRTDLSAPEVAYRMAARWRQENYFKYAREHFALDALDALDSCAGTGDDLDRLVPAPAKARALAQFAAANTAICGGIEAAGVRARQPGSGGKATVDPAAAAALLAAQDDLATAQAASRANHLPLAQVRPGSCLRGTERKLLTHAIRMSAYNTESALARLIRPHYGHGDDEARALLREAFTLTGDLQLTGNTLYVRLDPASP